MFLDFIHIEEANVYGLLHPNFVVKGSIHVHNYQFEIVVDGKIVEYTQVFNPVPHGFCLEVKLDAAQKDIQVYVTVDEEKFLLCERKNSLYKRIKSKIRKCFNRIFVSVKRIGQIIKRLIHALYKGARLLWREHHFLVPPSMYKMYIKKLKNKMNDVLYGNGFLNPMVPEDYQRWLEIQQASIIKEKIDVETLQYKPLISIVIPVYNISRKYLSECLDSILTQSYSNFEICLADDCSTLEETLQTLKEYQSKDHRIKVKHRSENGHISRTTNDAIAMAKGEFIGFMDNDDLLAENALYEVVKVLNQDATLDLIYSDEDKLDMDGNRREPHFKPDFSPEGLLSNNYICHFVVARKTIIDKIGGLRVGYEGAQDYDMLLRFTEETNRIYHIDKVLYHWRMIPGSTAATIDSKNYAIERGRQAVEDALHRRKRKGTVKIHDTIPYYIVNYEYDIEPSICIIVPTKDYADVTEECLESVFTLTTYKNYEVILVNNNSEEEKTFALFKKYQDKYSNFRVLDANFEFNYSKINNLAVENSTAEYIVLLNNDTKIVTPNWLEIMVGYAMQDHIGTVGAKLLYPDGTIQHGGIVAGIGGVASHVFIDEPRDSFGLYARLAIPYNYIGNTAACLMVSRKKFEQVNGLEEDLKVAFNDVDLNFKLVDKGYYNVFLPQVEVYHYESKSRGLDTTTEKYKRFLFEQNYMRDKWLKYIERDPFYNRNFSLIRGYLLDPSYSVNKGENHDEV